MLKVWCCGVWILRNVCSGVSSGFQGGYQNGFRWLHASGTTIGSYTIGSYTNGKGTFAALRLVYPGGSNVFERASLHVLPLAQGQRRARNDRRLKVAANCCLRPVKLDGRQFELVTYGTKMVLKKHMSLPNF